MPSITRNISLFTSGLDSSQFDAELKALATTAQHQYNLVDGSIVTLEYDVAPNAADLVLIDAAIAAHVPANEEDPEEATAVFGESYAMAELNVTTVRTGTAFDNILQLNAGPLVDDGKYRIGIGYTWSADNTSNDFLARVQARANPSDPFATIFEHQQEAKDSAGTSIGGSGTDQQHGAGGKPVYLDFSQGDTPEIRLEIARQSSAFYEVTVYSAVLEFWRVE